ncbi:hypothetical protein K438DRAFT_2102869 [Mycena galopus ATCC 62051]|nr:hypothetical protein K438DRAFT_2102869 [Mycena galopus ATCC 62051]
MKSRHFVDLLCCSSIHCHGILDRRPLQLRDYDLPQFNRSIPTAGLRFDSPTPIGRSAWLMREKLLPNKVISHGEGGEPQKKMFPDFADQRPPRHLQSQWDHKEKVKPGEIPVNWMEKLLPSLHGSIQELLAHKMPYQRPSARETAAIVYLTADLPSSPDFDPTTLAMPPTSVIREIVLALRSAPPAMIYRSILCAHIPGKQDTYPLWVVSYWAELRLVQETRQRWASAVHALETRIHLCKPTASLKTTEIDQMLELLDNNAELHNRSIRVVPSGHTREIIRIHQIEGLEYETSPKYRKLRELGEDIGNGGPKQLATVVNVGGDHWIALIVNFASKAVYYFDSLKQPVDSELQEAYNWWIGQHHSTEFGWVTLPCLRQRDRYNLLSVQNTKIPQFLSFLSLHGVFPCQTAVFWPKFKPEENKQKKIEKGCDDERLRTVAKILNRHYVATLPEAANVGLSFTFRFDIAGNDIESADGEDDQEPRTPISTPPPSPTILPISPMKGSLKRALGDPAIGSPPTSPVKKRDRAGDAHTEAREKEAAEFSPEQRAEEELQKSRDQVVVANEKREATKKRKREERERKYLAQVEAVIRNADFALKTTKKRKVQLSDEPDVTNMAEATRPARQIEQRFKEKHRNHPLVARKSSNRMSTSIRSGRRRLSSTAIAKYLQGREPKIFADLTATTIQNWFERDDLGVRIWKKSVLESAKVDENTPGHDKGGHRGALSAYPKAVDNIKQQLTRLREAVAPLNLIGISEAVHTQFCNEGYMVWDTGTRQRSAVSNSDTCLDGGQALL